ncbi:MAG: Ku protein [Deltaproteobacteria bacterium]|nr:Ku protein [Deltaproteobacteria bacterium]
MPHAIWKGSISFGLVNIPVGLYSAEKREEKIAFNLLDKHDLSPVGYKRYNKSTGEEVSAEDLVKGYEYEEGRYVVLGEEDFKQASPEATQTVEIIDFVDASEIHPVYYDKPYYLAPVKKGQKGYALLRETLKRTGKAAVARVVIHTREYIGVVMPYGKVLELDVLRYADELRSPDNLEVPDEDLTALNISEKEMDMAEKLIGNMESDWRPEKYHDTFRKELMEYIQKKIESGETAAPAQITAERALPAGGKVIDLMSLLKKSIEQTERAKPKEKKTAAK